MMDLLPTKYPKFLFIFCLLHTFFLSFFERFLASLKTGFSIFVIWGPHLHGIKGFVIPTKSFVKIGIKKIMLQQQNV